MHARRCEPERRFGRERLRHWLFRRSMRRRVARWLVLTALAVAVATAAFMHVGGASLTSSRRYAWLAAIAFVVVGAASSWIARRLARPLEEVARFADALASGDLEARLRTGRRVDFDVYSVNAALNKMAERITQQLADQRALLGAVSHELRSPLQRMKVAAELMRSGDLGPLPKLEREIADMDRLVGDLLASARVDFAALRPSVQDAAALALAALEQVEEAPEKLNVEDGGLRFTADPTLAVRALANLVENARRHGGGLVELTVSRVDGDRVRFAALDAGPGFAPDELERLFLPFQQTSTSTQVGLGLSLVRRIAEAHGGRAYAENRPDGGALVAIELPLVG